jgi:hypothetical protein
VFATYKTKKAVLIALTIFLFAIRMVIVATLWKASGLLLDNPIAPVLVSISAVYSLTAVIKFGNIFRFINSFEKSNPELTKIN